MTKVLLLAIAANLTSKLSTIRQRTKLYVVLMGHSDGLWFGN